jgi:pimeloyl-ACP methyl ester carboxylesterase
VVDVVDDVGAVLDALGIASFRAVGWSGGGPHALAAAARVRGCDRVVNVAGLAPLDGDDWAAGMAQANIDEFSRALAGESMLRQLLDRIAPMMTQTNPEAMFARMHDFLTSADVAAFRRNGNAEAEVFLAGIGRAMAHGNDGWVDDDLALASDWGFDLASVSAPVTILHGELDRMVPIGHGRRLAELLPTASLHAIPTDGHVSAFLDHSHDIVAALLR